MKRQRPLRVGFDLDGVILYNPARIARPIIVLFKKLLKKDLNKFHYPKTKLQKFIWLLLHKSSIFVDPGYEELKKLTKKGKVETYIVSARYESLKGDFQKWLERIDAGKYFSGFYYNNNDEQPYIFKEKIINELNLDIFVEDNWDIVKYLREKMKEKRVKIFWIYNLLDRKIPYPYKFPTLKQVVLQLEKIVK